MAIRVGRWDCKACGHKGNLGPETHCKNCGSTRPKDVVFYLPTDAKVIKKKEQLEEAKSGADWICAYCASNNKALNTVCTTCGNDRTENEDEALEEREYTLDQLPTESVKRVRRIHPEEQPKPKKKGLQGILSALGLGGLVAFLFSFNTTIDVPVVQMQWERVIEVREYKRVIEEDWTLPSDGDLIESFRDIYEYDQRLIGYETRTRTVQRQVGTRRVLCGQRDMGNGYFEEVHCDEPVYENVEETYEEPVYEQIPVYKQKYRYYIMKWVKISPLRASGMNKAVYWPEETDDMKANPNRFKTGRQKEVYRFTVEDHKGKRHTYEADFDYWDTLRQGKLLKAKKSTIFGTYKGLNEEL